VAQTATVAPMKVASIATTGTYEYAGIKKTIDDLTGILQAQKVTPAGGLFGMYFDNPANVKPEICRYEICVQVPPTTKNQKLDAKTHFAIKDAPEMMVAQTAYMGPYDKVAPTYEKLFKWVADNKLEAATPPVMVEWYLSDPAKVKSESLMANVAVTLKPPAPPADTTKKAGEPKKEEPKKETKTPTGGK
jgi:DNA gyrase inhibitor GyrI